MKVVNYKAHSGSNGFSGFFDLEFDEIGVVVRGCRIFEQDTGARWIGFPQKEWKKRDGTLGYTNLVDCVDPDAEERIHETVFAQLDKIRGGRPKPTEPAESAMTTVNITDEDIPF
jgi:hypothetical protein